MFPAAERKHTELDPNLAELNPSFAKYVNAVHRTSVDQDMARKKDLLIEPDCWIALGIYRTP